MQSGRVEQLSYMLDHVPMGAALLDATTLHILYLNAYLRVLCAETSAQPELIGQTLTTLLTPPMAARILPMLEKVSKDGDRIEYAELPYEGFLESRGRTYWRISIERIASNADSYLLMIMVEDVTDKVRSRLHLNAIDAISSALAGPSSLHSVLDRILQVLQEMFGSKRCAVFLLDNSVPTPDLRSIKETEDALSTSNDQPRSATVAAQHGLHPSALDWHPLVDDRLLLGQALQQRRTLLIPDTSLIPEVELPLLWHQGQPRRPGSVLCVPIFEPHPGSVQQRGLQRAVSEPRPGDIVLGSIEVYHRRARDFSAEEVTLLERFAQQAGLAIQNARMIRSIDRWARAASRQARQKENMMQAIPNGVVIYDPRWRVADFNQAARQLLGWSDDVLGLPIVEALKRSQTPLHKELLEQGQVIEAIEQRALTGQVDELKVPSWEGRPATIRCSYTPIRDELGDIFAFIIIYHDVTEEVAAREKIEAEVVARTAELKQRNLALQQAKAAQELSNARMALLLEQLPSGVLLINAHNSHIEMINQHAIHLLQQIGVAFEPAHDLEEACKRAIGRNFTELLRPIHFATPSGAPLPYEEQPLWQALTTGQTCEAELHTIRKDGQIVHWLVNAAPLYTLEGQVGSAILVIQEITRIKALERAREDFFTTMAHELKTPLANIRAHLSALLTHDLEWSREEQQDFLQTADEQVDRLVGMINHFLDASRVEAGALRLEQEAILIPELVEDLQDRLEALIASSRRSLEIEITGPLPAVQGDYELIMSVLINLLSNAFRYAPEGDAVELRLEPLSPTPHQATSSVLFLVTDHGPGISQEQQAALFTRFSTFAAMSRPSIDRPGQPTTERQVRSSRWSPATGLGLYISRGIIEAHQSKLLLTSSPGQGATFGFTLPAFPVKSSADTMEVERMEKDGYTG
ncbi:PAS domain-containing protein [Tengunoibacter tsumagoiensis]|uniref:histidine kinase n=1 Tax=Tengunoibacter tsumagoiensis TaxID=2014871 RepID=A0A402A1N7_9CHLR|nr:PAS domain-containing protein [Tengunoibacter tsumagoiensis]GCE12972.1 hypothetical protein KTT_28310 [Tengunoibacter tsumagoiensis]